MKKLLSLLSALMICVSLAACGGPNKQPAIDAHNKAGAAVNALIEVINQNPEAVTDEDIAFMDGMVELLNQCGDVLENDKTLDQNALDEWVDVCEEIEQWAIDAKAGLEN